MIFSFILGILFLVSLGINFCLSKILKNTYDILLNGEPQIKTLSAYDGKYYPCNLFIQLKFNSLADEQVIDFSQYEENKIIGMTYYIKDDLFPEYKKRLSIEDAERPQFIPNVIVFQPMEGVWLWKPKRDI